MSGFSVDGCVEEILCGEVMEMEGVKMTYTCDKGPTLVPDNMPVDPVDELEGPLRGRGEPC